MMRYAIGTLALATAVSSANLAAQTQHPRGQQANLPPAATAQTPQASTERPLLKNPKAGEWSPMPDIMPKGAEMQIVHGNPASGAADFYFKVPPNYTFPWHFHTPVEKRFVDEGMLRWELRGGETKTLDAGNYVYVPARSPHRVTCTSNQTCYFFLASTGPFDMHLVDEKTWTTTKSWRASGGVKGGSR